MPFRTAAQIARDKQIEDEAHGPEGESPRDKFVRLGTSRMNRVLNTIKLLGNLASPAYEYTEQDIADIKQSIVTCLADTLKKFERHHRGEKVEFHFGEQAPDPKQKSDAW